jgi:acyl-CoA synthetase (AMP-forming)/AMP-acid ligase II
MTTPLKQTVHELLENGVADATALAAVERPPLTFAGLRQLIRDTVVSLNQLGYGRGDSVAIVLPNGPEMATAFLGVSSACVSAPLNPAYVDHEFEFYLSDLQAKALIAPAGSDSPAIGVAGRLNIPVVDLVVDPSSPAGTFTLRGPDGKDVVPAADAQPDLAQPDDVGLILHTSGTTSRPKQVPLRQRNLAASARHIGATLSLTPQDRCMNIMPLFHIHGLIAATLSSLAAGGSVFATEGFNALKFMAQLEEARPTWYTAVPTMHQAILARGQRQEAAARAAGLRFIRSSSASLPPQVMTALEALFACPVIESYGMTEASHQMTSNRLPPGLRKPGSVGSAAGPQVAILTEGGQVTTEAGTLGEVVISGPNVTLGYENNPKANAESFIARDGVPYPWFRTGDQGTLDGDGFLTITGRLKEIINRGGEKVSPKEVDEAVLDHPAVAQVVTFAMPHDKLGEEVACAVVLKEGMALEERALRDFLAARLADFKVPRKVVFLAEIPKGATGKLQRIGLAQKLGLGA